MSTLRLPEPIAAYFDADRHGPDALTRCFTKSTSIFSEIVSSRGLPAQSAAGYIEETS